VNTLIIGEKRMSPTPELEPQSTFFLAKWTVEIALGIIGLLTAYVLKVKGSKTDVVTAYQLQAEILLMRQDMQREVNSAIEAHEQNMKDYIKENMDHMKDILEAHNK